MLLRSGPRICISSDDDTKRGRRQARRVLLGGRVAAPPKQATKRATTRRVHNLQIANQRKRQQQLRGNQMALATTRKLRRAHASGRFGVWSILPDARQAVRQDAVSAARHVLIHSMRRGRGGGAAGADGSKKEEEGGEEAATPTMDAFQLFVVLGGRGVCASELITHSHPSLKNYTVIFSREQRSPHNALASRMWTLPIQGTAFVVSNIVMQFLSSRREPKGMEPHMVKLSHLHESLMLCQRGPLSPPPHLGGDTMPLLGCLTVRQFNSLRPDEARYLLVACINRTMTRDGCARNSLFRLKVPEVLNQPSRHLCVGCMAAEALRRRARGVPAAEQQLEIYFTGKVVRGVWCCARCAWLHPRFVRHIVCLAFGGFPMRTLSTA